MKIDRKALAVKARALGFTMPQMQLLLAQERFIVRVATVPNGASMIWKGGSLILRAFQNLNKPRYTVDIDFLARGIALIDVDRLFESALTVDLVDGFQFRAMTKQSMKRETPYGGYRYEITWSFNGKPGPQKLKVDVCTGDTVLPIFKEMQDVAVLSTDSISIGIYPPEYIFAEKLETVSRLKTGNTRTKDVVDLWSLRHSIERKKTKKAILQCYENRGTKFNPSEISAILTNPTLMEYHSRQIEKKYHGHGLPDYQVIASDISSFIEDLAGSSS